MNSPRILIFIVAYNHEDFIGKVLSRIPTSLAQHDTEILIIDDASKDRTFEAALEYIEAHDLPFKINVLVNPTNQRYGGNQKIGFHYAIENGFDILALVHGDGQYAPEALPELLAPIIDDQVDLVMGSRMATRFGALKGGMPLYKYVGNKILTAYQNALLGTHLYEFHTGYRLYSVKALQQVPFDLVTNEFHFDNEMFIQFHLAGLRTKELPIDTHYGDEVCNVDGFKYAWDIVKTTTVARLQRTTLFYRRKYDVGPDRANDQDLYESKLAFPSTHAELVAEIESGARVLNIGCAGAHVARALVGKGCTVTGIDFSPEPDDSPFYAYHQISRDLVTLPVDFQDFDVVVAMDMLGRFNNPDAFMESFAAMARRVPDIKIFVTNGNVLFILNRLLALFGNFNYGKRGQLDLSHRRLFTVSSLKRMISDYNFQVLTVKGVPAPVPLVVKNGVLARLLLGLNTMLIKVSKSLFAYQVVLSIRPMPSLPWLLEQTKDMTRRRRALMESDK